MSEEIVRLCRWPEEDEIGIFVITCSCNKWSFEGTSQEIRKASRDHDDSPWTNHIVTIIGKKEVS